MSNGKRKKFEVCLISVWDGFIWWKFLMKRRKIVYVWINVEWEYLRLIEGNIWV